MYLLKETVKQAFILSINYNVKLIEAICSIENIFKKCRGIKLYNAILVYLIAELRRMSCLRCRDGYLCSLSIAIHV